MAITLFLIFIFHFIQSVAFPLLKMYGEKWLDNHFKNKK